MKIRDLLELYKPDYYATHVILRRLNCTSEINASIAFIKNRGIGDYDVCSFNIEDNVLVITYFDEE